jgi:UDP-N-acetylglucosamine transferase subunit ALG13
VLPRLARYGEHFDDHQRQIVDKLADLDLIVPIGVEISEEDAAAALRPLSLPPGLERLPPLTDCLRARVQDALARLAAGP